MSFSFVWFVTPLCNFYAIHQHCAILSTWQLQKIAKLLNCTVPLLLSTPDCNHSLLQVVEPSAILERSRSVNPAQLTKVIKTPINLPDLNVPQAILLARFSNEKVADLTLHCYTRQFSLARQWRAWRHFCWGHFRHHHLNLIVSYGFAIASLMTQPHLLRKALVP